MSSKSPKKEHKHSSGSSVHKKIYAAFKASPIKGIEMAKQYLIEPNYTSFESFMEDIKKTQHINSCIVSWDDSMLTARCLDCQKSDNSCICIPCFLAGHHDNHHSYIVSGSGCGNCDCGDPNFWKPSGNCPNHPGPEPNPDQTQMTPENREKFLHLFKAALKAAFKTSNDKDAAIIFEWVETFLKIGDGLRRCIAIVLSNIDEKLYYSSLSKMTEVKINSFISLIGGIINDSYFSTHLGYSLYKHYFDLRYDIQQALLNPRFDIKSLPFYPIGKYLNFAFHFFNRGPLYYAIKTYNFNWVEFCIQSLRFIFQTIEELQLDPQFYEKNSESSISGHIWYLQKFLEPLVQDDTQHESIQLFINEFGSFLSDYEAMVTFKFPQIPQDESDSNYVYFFLLYNLCQFIQVLTNKTELSPMNQFFDLSVVFNSLCKFIQAQKSKKKQFIASAYDPDVDISFFLPLHLLFYSLLILIPNPAETIAELCTKNAVDLNEFCQDAIVYPLRILVAFWQPNHFNKLNRSTLFNITTNIEKPANMFQPMFGLVQLLFAIAPDKNSIINEIMIIFGCLAPPTIDFKLPSKHTSYSELSHMKDVMSKIEDIAENSFLHAAIFLVSLITDRTIIRNNAVLIKRLRVMELLKIKQATAKDIESFVQDLLSNPIFGDDVQSFAERVVSSHGSYFKLTNDDEFTLFFPLIQYQNRMDLLMKNPDKLITIPDYVNMPYNLSLKECIGSPVYISLMYKCLASDVITATQVGLTMFVLLMRNVIKFTPNSYKMENITFEYTSLNSLIDNFKRILDEGNQNFLTVNVVKANSSNSIIALVQKKKHLGLEAMCKTQIPEFLKPKEAIEETERAKKAKSKDLREKIMKEFKEKRDQFSQNGMCHQKTENDQPPTEKGQQTSNLLCDVCQTSNPDLPIGFPCLSLPCMFPEIINNQLHDLYTPLETMNPTQSLAICAHQIHFQCYRNLVSTERKKSMARNLDPNTNSYHCPIDRGLRNCLLPTFPLNPTLQDDFLVKPASTMIDAILDFMQNAFPGANPELALKSYYGMILTFEVRHRSRPECLDGPTVPYLIRNVLLTLYHSGNCRNLSLDPKSDPLLLLIDSIMKSNNPYNEFPEFVKTFSKDLKDEYLYEFLRRAALIEEFALNRVNSELTEDQRMSHFIDWDENLSFNNLIDRYHLQYMPKIVELPLFTTIPLADRFVHLYQPPYNINIFDNYFVKFIDLLTGRTVVYSNQPNQQAVKEKAKLPLMSEYITNQYHGGLVMFMALTGPNASDLIYSCNAAQRLFNMDGFYVDQFGDNDRGLRRGTFLSLSKDKLENALDKVLSGEILLY